MKKKDKWYGLKEGIILYLAISKIMYWTNTFAQMTQNDFAEAWPIFVERILGQDLPLVLVVACLVIIDMSKGKFYIKVAIGYVAYLAVVFAYLLVLALALGYGVMAGVQEFGYMYTSYTIMYVIVAVSLSVKDYFMTKVKGMPKDTQEDDSEVARDTVLAEKNARIAELEAQLYAQNNRH